MTLVEESNTDGGYCYLCVEKKANAKEMVWNANELTSEDCRNYWTEIDAGLQWRSIHYGDNKYRCFNDIGGHCYPQDICTRKECMDKWSEIAAA